MCRGVNFEGFELIDYRAQTHRGPGKNMLRQHLVVVSFSIQGVTPFFSDEMLVLLATILKLILMQQWFIFPTREIRTKLRKMVSPPIWKNKPLPNANEACFFFGPLWVYALQSINSKPSKLTPLHIQGQKFLEWDSTLTKTPIFRRMVQ